MGKCWNMFREIMHLLKGASEWQRLCVRLGIGEKKAVLVLVNDNPRLDLYALYYLRDFMDRKYAEQAIVFSDDKKVCNRAVRMKQKGKLPDSVKIYRCPAEKMRALYKYYSFYKFSDKIVFTYTDDPKDNQLGKALRETPVNERDAVCLGLYHLRKISEKD